MQGLTICSLVHTCCKKKIYTERNCVQIKCSQLYMYNQMLPCSLKDKPLTAKLIMLLVYKRTITVNEC